MTSVEIKRNTPGEREVVVASIQMHPHIGDKARNVARSVELVRQAAHAGAQVIVLPELSNTGYVFESKDEVFELAEQLPTGQTILTWSECAKELGIYLVAGIAEREGNRLYNAAAFLGPDGYIGSYRKLHLWQDENRFFEKGDRGLPVFDTPVGRLAIAICYDGWFPETYRLLALDGVDIVCVPTNWVPMPNQPMDSIPMANILAMAAAHSNGLSIVCANRIGTERNQQFIGSSLIVGSHGWPIAGPASSDKEEILYARIDINQARGGRRLNVFNHVLLDRRDDIYQLSRGSEF